MKDMIERQAAIEAIEWGITYAKAINKNTSEVTQLFQESNNELLKAAKRVKALPSVQPEPSEITDEQAILHLQSTGWMQNHDREMYESGLRERLADDSGSYDSLVPCDDTISRQAAIDTLMSEPPEMNYGFYYAEKIKKLPSAQPTQTNTPNALKALDCVSRQSAIDALGAICDRECVYSKAQRSTMCDACRLGSAFDVIEELPSAQPEQKKGKWIGTTKHYKDDQQEFYYLEVTCSECGVMQKIGWRDAKYCPNCGAELEEGEQDE